MTVNHDVAGSNPASGASGLFVKRLRHRPFTAGSGVRIPHRSPWAISSAGRASALQAECQQFDPVIAHQKKASRDPLRGAFFLPFSSHLIYHLTSCIRDSLHFARRFAPSKCVRCGTSSILLSPTRMKSSTCSAPWNFLLPFFLLPHLSFNLLHPHSQSFARRFAPSNDVRCGTSSILLSPTRTKRLHVLRAVRSFFFFTFLLTLSFNLLHPRLTTFCASLRSFKMCSLRNQFDPVIAHQKKASRDPLRGAFFLPFC